MGALRSLPQVVGSGDKGEGSSSQPVGPHASRVLCHISAFPLSHNFSRAQTPLVDNCDTEAHIVMDLLKDPSASA